MTSSGDEFVYDFRFHVQAYSYGSSLGKRVVEISVVAKNEEAALKRLGESLSLLVANVSVRE